MSRMVILSAGEGSCFRHFDEIRLGLKMNIHNR